MRGNIHVLVEMPNRMKKHACLRKAEKPRVNKKYAEEIGLKRWVMEGS